MGTVIPYVPGQWLDNNGAIAAGYKLFSYIAGTTTKQNTYSDQALTTPNANPIILDSSGRATIFLASLSYKFVLAPPTDTDPPSSPIWTRDNITAIAPLFVNLDISGVAGETIGASRCAYVSDGSGGKTAGRWYNTDPANAYSSSAPKVIGFNVTGAQLLVGVTGTFRRLGTVTGQAGLTAGNTLYATTGGALISVAPTFNARAVAVADSTTSFVVLGSDPFVENLLKGFAFSSGQSGSAVAGVDFQLSSYNVTIPGNFLAQPGDGLIVEGLLTLAASANAKALKFQVGAGTLNTAFSTALNVANHIVPFRYVIRRRTSTTGSQIGAAWIGAASGAVATPVVANLGIAAADWTIDQTLKIIVNGATATNELTLTDYSVATARGLVGVTV